MILILEHNKMIFFLFMKKNARGKGKGGEKNGERGKGKWWEKCVKRHFYLFLLLFKKR